MGGKALAIADILRNEHKGKQLWMDAIHELDKDNQGLMETPRENLISYSGEQEELRIRLGDSIIQMAELQRKLNSQIQLNLL